MPVITQVEAVSCVGGRDQFEHVEWDTTGVHLLEDQANRFLCRSLTVEGRHAILEVGDHVFGHQSEALVATNQGFNR